MIIMMIIITPENGNEEILSQSLIFSSWRKRITASNSHILTLTLLT